ASSTNSKLILIVNTVSTVVSTAEFLLLNLAKLLAEFAYLGCTLPTQGMRSIISTVSISLEGFMPSILLLVVIIVTVVIVVVILVVVVVAIVGVVVVVVGVSAIIKLSFVIIAVTFPSILLDNPPIKTSISFSVFGTMFGHKTANSWNPLTSRTILIGQEPFQFGSGDPVGLFHPNRLGVCIPPGQGVIG
ncbi:hypothetical protein Tco_1412254, partial [Tanacetum coccineum]